MGLWVGHNPSIQEAPNGMSIAQKIAEAKRREIINKSGLKRAERFVGEKSQIVGDKAAGVVEQTALFTGEAIRQGHADFSREQEMLSGMFMGGDGTFWGLDDSSTGVQINHDLNPSRRDSTNKTGSIFGMGNGERSGLF